MNNKYGYQVPQKKHPLKPKPYKNKAYLEWLHNQGLTCMICGSEQIEIHHIDQGAKGRADNRTVPLCAEHHRGKFSPHGAEKRSFEAKYMDSMESYAEKLFIRFKEEEVL